MELTSDNVDQIFEDCLVYDQEYKNEDTASLVGVASMTTRLKRHKLNEYKSAIIDMLDQLPDEFKVNQGGGMSFLNMCMRKDGVQWTDLQSRMDQLVLLGLGIERVEFCLPREAWCVLPGRMPYLAVKF